jgi:succinate-acetate transporter protein
MATHTETSPADLGATSSGFSIADPAPLGLAAFALTTFLLSAAKAGVLNAGVESIALSAALFYGGAVQVAAGMWEFRRGNTFGATAFSSYGAFWLTFWGLGEFFKPLPGVSATDKGHAVGMFLLAWTIFTAILLVASLRTTGVLAVTFAVLTLTFLLLSLGAFQASSSLTKTGGWLGILTALLAWYGAFAAVVNETWKRPAIPVWRIG